MLDITEDYLLLRGYKCALKSQAALLEPCTCSVEITW